MAQQRRSDPIEEGLNALFRALGSGLKSAWYGAKKLHGPVQIGLLIAALLLCGAGILFRGRIWQLETLFGRPFGIVPKLILLAVLFTLPLLYLAILGQQKAEEPAAFEQIGFLNRDGTPPRLVGTREEKHIARSVEVLSYESYIPLERWRDKRGELETALNRTIRNISQGKDKRTVELMTVSSEVRIPDSVPWDDAYISEADGVICVGQDIIQQVSFNLNKTPHVIVAGETGSGKSVILRTILWQMIMKECRIFMIDFKGGVEFGKRFEQYGEVITERDRALNVLKLLVAENAARLSLFRETEVKNLPEYNRKTGSNLCRIAVFIDEIAEMMDKTGADDKSIYAEMEGCLATLARLSRATGINLIVGVQRPDAKVLPGQIKNNLPVRICGRFADKPPSEIVLGNTMATCLPEIKGRFLYRMGNEITEFQAYLFDDDKNLRDVDVEPGDLLTGGPELEEPEDDGDGYEDVPPPAAQRARGRKKAAVQAAARYAAEEAEDGFDFDFDDEEE